VEPFFSSARHVCLHAQCSVAASALDLRREDVTSTTSVSEGTKYSY